MTAGAATVVIWSNGTVFTAVTIVAVAFALQADTVISTISTTFSTGLNDDWVDRSALDDGFVDSKIDAVFARVVYGVRGAVGTVEVVSNLNDGVVEASRLDDEAHVVASGCQWVSGNIVSVDDECTS